MTDTIMEISASISFTERARHLDVAKAIADKAASRASYDRLDIASLTIGPVTVWIDATPDGQSTIGIYRQFLGRRELDELKRLNQEMVDLAAAHDLADRILMPNGMLPRVEIR